MLFIILITYLIGSLCCDFKYIDLGYLIVIVLSFVRFVKVKEIN